MKYPLHADDFVIDDPAEEIICKYRAKIQPGDGSIFTWRTKQCALEKRKKGGDFSKDSVLSTREWIAEKKEANI